MKSAEPGGRCDASHCLHWSMERTILVERKVRANLVVIGATICQQMAKVAFAEHHDMVEAFASDRPDQPFNITVLSRRAWRN